MDLAWYYLIVAFIFGYLIRRPKRPPKLDIDSLGTDELYVTDNSVYGKVTVKGRFIPMTDISNQSSKLH